MKRFAMVLAAVLAFAAAPAAEAAVLQIQISGLDLVYTGGPTGGVICDATACAGGTGLTAQSDPVLTMNFLVDDVLVGSLSSDIWVDIRLNVEGGIASGGPLPGQAIINGDIFDLLTSGAGWGLALDINGGFVSYSGTTLSFNGSATVNAIFAQDLPFGLIMGMPVVVSFSSNNLSGVTTSGGFLTGLDSAGTGEVTGQAVVPEPASMLLIGTGLLFVATRVRRRRLQS